MIYASLTSSLTARHTPLSFQHFLSLLFLIGTVGAQRTPIVVGDYNDQPPIIRVELQPSLSHAVNATITCRINRDVSWLFHKLDFFKCNGTVDDPVRCELLATRVTSMNPSKYRVPMPRGSSMSLQIIGVQPSDEGIYKCELINEDEEISPNDRIIGSAVFDLIVRQRVSDVRFVNTSTVQLHGDWMRVQFDKPSLLICEVLGGYPPPQVEVYNDGSEITDRMQRVHEVTPHGFVTRLIYDNFRINDRNWEHQHVRCSAFIDDPLFDRSGFSDTKKIQLSYAPHVESCTTLDNRVIGKASALVCTISANPPLQHATWEIKHMNVTVRNNESTPIGIQSKMEERQVFMESKNAVRYEVRLDIANVSQLHKGNYTLRVGNRIGNTVFTYNYKPESKAHVVENVASYRSNTARSSGQKISPIIMLILSLLTIHLLSWSTRTSMQPQNHQLTIAN